jgi:dUTP pyrophosphatase
MALIYFAHPIDRANDTHQHNVQRVRDGLALLQGVATFDPATSWIVTAPFEPQVQHHNEQILRGSDCVIALLPSDTWTRGVPVEIAIALENKIPVVLVVDYKFNTASMIESYWSTHKGVHLCNSDFTTVATVLAGKLATQHQQSTNTKLVARWTGDGAQLQQAHEGDAGFDLAYNGAEPLIIEAGQRAAVPTGVCVEMPAGFYSLIVGRSSSFSKRDLLVPLSVIDAGFRGELFAVCWNYGTQQQVIMPNERVAQLLPMPLTADLLQWENTTLSDSARGDRGFGSSGL